MQISADEFLRFLDAVNSVCGNGIEAATSEILVLRRISAN